MHVSDTRRIGQSREPIETDSFWKVYLLTATIALPLKFTLRIAFAVIVTVASHVFQVPIEAQLSRSTTRGGKAPKRFGLHEG